MQSTDAVVRVHFTILVALGCAGMRWDALGCACVKNISLLSSRPHALFPRGWDPLADRLVPRFLMNVFTTK
jgi:hypothetical protein